MGRRLLIAAALLALVPAGAPPPRGTRGKPAQLVGPRDQNLTAAGLMGDEGAADFRPADPLTAQALEDLVFGLKGTGLSRPTRPVPAPVNPVTPNPTVPGSTRTTTRIDVPDHDQSDDHGPTTPTVRPRPTVTTTTTDDRCPAGAPKQAAQPDAPGAR